MTRKGKKVQTLFSYKRQRFLKQNLLILFIILLAFGIRVLGVYPGYPQIHPDEGTSYYTAIYQLYHWFDPNRYDYPAGMPLIHAFLYIVLFIPFMTVKVLFSNPESVIDLLFNPSHFFTAYKDAIFGLRDINAFFWSRYIAATFGALSVLMVYITTKKLFNKEVGIFAAIFLAFNFRHNVGSHFGLPDVHNSFFAMLALYASVLLLEKNTRKRYIFAAVTAAISFSLKYQPFAFLPIIIVHIMWTIRKKSPWYLFHPNIVIGGFVSIATFLIINPYYIFHIGDAMYQNSRDYLRYQMGIVYFRVYPYFYLFHWGIGRLPFLAIIGGIITMLLRNPKKFILPFSFACTFMFVMTVYSNGGIYPRNFVTVMPFLMMFAGYFLFSLHTVFKKFFSKTVSLILIIIVVIAVNIPSAKDSFLLSSEYAKPWTFDTLSAWLDKNIPNGVFIRNYLLFLPYKSATLLREKNVKQLEWSYDKGSNSLAEFQKEGTDFAIINSYIYQSGIYQWREFPNPKMYLKYSTVPFDYLENSFLGLAVKELTQYSVFEAYKLWQAQETSNYVVFKIPSKPKEIGNTIKSFTFDRKDTLWKLRNIFGFDPIVSKWDEKEGRTAKGSIKITGPGNRTVPSRMGSPPISVKEGKLYTVTGWIKNSSPSYSIYPDGDGYLRLDFYKSNNESELDSIGFQVAVSQRAKVTTTGEWGQVAASIVAPKGAKYLTISFQPKESIYYSLYLDDVELYETDQIPSEPFRNIPYIKSTIPKESLYFNGFL